MSGASGIQGQVVAVGAYVVLLGGILGYGIREHLRGRRDARPTGLASAVDAERRTITVRHEPNRAPLATVTARIPSRRAPSVDACERIWVETLALWNLEPDADLLDEWEQAR